MHQFGFGQRYAHAVSDVLRGQAALCQGQGLGIVRGNVAYRAQIIEFCAQLADFLAQLPYLALKIGTRQMFGQLFSETGDWRGRFRGRLRNGWRGGKQLEVDHVVPFSAPADGQRRHRLRQFGRQCRLRGCNLGQGGYLFNGSGGPFANPQQPDHGNQQIEDRPTHQEQDCLSPAEHPSLHPHPTSSPCPFPSLAPIIVGGHPR